VSKYSGPEDAIDAAIRVYTTGTDSLRERMLDAIEEYERVSALMNECDEDGCTRQATCGWPTHDGGYRRTCGLHVR
jgi:hypothetical protein